MMLKDMPLGSVVHNIEMVPGRGGVLIRSAGTSAQLMARSGGYATIKMPSGEVRMVRFDLAGSLDLSDGYRLLIDAELERRKD